MIGPSLALPEGEGTKNACTAFALSSFGGVGGGSIYCPSSFHPIFQTKAF